MPRSLEVLVRGLPPDVDNEEVAGAFSRCGKVVRASIRPKPFLASPSGYVHFASQESVDRALALHKTEILGRQVSVHALFEPVDTITVGRVPQGVDETRLKAFFSSCGRVLDAKLHVSVTDEAGLAYGFIRFASPESVPKALKLDRARFAGRTLDVTRTKQRAEDRSIWDDYAESADITSRSVYISGLPPQVNEDQLKVAFEKYGVVALARVWRALSTGNSLGIGFVQFASPDSVENAVVAREEVAGQRIQIKRYSPMRPKALDHPVRLAEHQLRPTTSVFVGRLAADVDNTLLRRAFERFGSVVRANVRRHSNGGKSRGFGFVDFALPDSVEQVVEHSWKLKINGFTVKISRNYKDRDAHPSALSVPSDIRSGGQPPRLKLLEI